MITNKYWKINKRMQYWINWQKRNGVKLGQVEFNPTSAFEVKQLNSSNIRSIAAYVTKYVTKNSAKLLHGAYFKLIIRPLIRPLKQKNPINCSVYRVYQVVKVVPLGLEPRTT